MARITKVIGLVKNAIAVAKAVVTPVATVLIVVLAGVFGIILYKTGGLKV